MVREGQTVFDLAVERYGELDFASELVSLNRISFDGALAITDTVESSESGKGDEEVKNDFKATNYTPVND
jgi:hypothetical protein